MILNIPNIIAETMTATPQPPIGTIEKDQVKPPLKPVDPHEERKQRHREKLETIGAVGAFARPALSSIGYGAGSVLSAKALGAAGQGISYVLDKFKGAAAP